MPEKSVREMSRREQAHFSLAAKVFHASLMGSVVLGLVAMLIGLGLYTYALIGQYIGEAFGLARSTALVVRQVVDTDRMVNDVMEQYRALSDEERAQTGTEAYRARFAHLTEGEDYATLCSVFRVFRDSSNVDDVYLAVFDRESGALVYVCDPDERDGYVCMPGDWEAAEKRELEKFLTWDGNGKLYDISRTEKYGWLCTAGVPIHDVGGEIRGFLLADLSLANLTDGMHAFVLQYVLALLVVIFLIGYLITRHMKRTLVRPINEIADAAQRYAADRRSGVGGTDHFSLLNIRTGDEVENLSLVMADMERDLSEYEEHLTAITAEKERMNVELSLANRIQSDMLPNIFPPFPERTELDIYASMDPAKEVGGDFYDFFLIDEDHLGLVMADVSGKGVPAALFMMASKILLKTGALSGRSPHEVLETVNAQICGNNREEMFVTVWLGVLDLTTGVLRASNAGHEYPILMQPGGGYEIVRDKHGFVVGGMEGVSYYDYELQLKTGAKLFLYTDGLPEATDEKGELFGMERTLDVLNRFRGDAPQALLAHVHEAADAFVGSAPQFDDLTMLCLHYIGTPDKEGPRMKKLELEASVDNIEKITDFINAELEAMDCPMKAQMQIDVAVDEVFANIANYAYEGAKGGAVVCFEAQDDPRGAMITFVDRGIPFNPLESKDPDTSLSAEERQIGGLGIFLVKKTMDEMRYERRGEENVLRITKLF